MTGEANNEEHVANSQILKSAELHGLSSQKLFSNIEYASRETGRAVGWAKNPLFF